MDNCKFFMADGRPAAAAAAPGAPYVPGHAPAAGQAPPCAPGYAPGYGAAALPPLAFGPGYAAASTLPPYAPGHAPAAGQAPQHTGACAPAPAPSAPAKAAADAGCARRYRRLAGRLGAAFGLLVALSWLLEFLGGRLYFALMPTATSYPLWLVWLLSFLPLYGVALPVYGQLTRPLPHIRPQRQKLTPQRFGQLLCMALALLYLGALAGNGLNWLLGLLKGQPIPSNVEAIVSAAPLWQTLLFTCVIAPIGEELIFGRLLEYSLPFGERPAILLCALAFGAFHGNLYQFFYAFLVRLILAQLYLRSGRLGACMAMHSLLNLMGGVVGQLLQSAGIKVQAAYGLFLLLVVGAGVVLLARRWRRTAWRRGRPGAKARWLFASPGMLLTWTLSLILIALSLL